MTHDTTAIPWEASFGPTKYAVLWKSRDAVANHRSCTKGHCSLVMGFGQRKKMILGYLQSDEFMTRKERNCFLLCKPQDLLLTSLVIKYYASIANPTRLGEDDDAGAVEKSVHSSPHLGTLP